MEQRQQEQPVLPGGRANPVLPGGVEPQALHHAGQSWYGKRMQGYVSAHQKRVKAANRRLRRKLSRWRHKTITRNRRRKGVGA